MFKRVVRALFISVGCFVSAGTSGYAAACSIHSELPDMGIIEIQKDQFKLREDLKKVDLSAYAELKMVGHDSFFGCQNLSDVILPGSVTKIDDFAFAFCENLEKITGWDSVRTIGVGAFRATGLTELVVPNSVKMMLFEAFSGCGKLRKVIIPSSVETIGFYCFQGCEQLAEVTLPATANIGTDAFLDCPCLKDVYWTSGKPTPEQMREFPEGVVHHDA